MLSLRPLTLLSTAILITTTLLHAMEKPQVSIVPYDHERDCVAVKAIMEADSKYLLYPGQPLKHTFKYITSDKYKTDVLRVNNTTVGFINYVVYDVKILWLFHWFRAEALHLLGVDKTHRRNGYAKQLVEHAIEHGKNEDVDKVVLQTKTENVGAQKLYEKLGFKGIVGATDAMYALELK